MVGRSHNSGYFCIYTQFYALCPINVSKFTLDAFFNAFYSFLIDNHKNITISSGSVLKFKLCLIVAFVNFQSKQIQLLVEKAMVHMMCRIDPDT